MGAVALQTQCCLQQRDDEWETDEEEGAREGAVQLVSLCLGMGTLAAALLARLLAHRPRCPGAFRTQPSSPRAEGRPVQMHVNVTLRM